jgi:putative copper resistance protein D
VLATLDLGPTDFFSRITFHPVPLVVVVLAVAWYVSRVRRLSARGEHWPVARSAAFALATALVAAATLSGLDAYLRTSFSVHAIQQLMLFMLAPPFLALSAPLTLGVEAGGKGAARLRRLVLGPVGRVVLHPVAGWALYGSALFALYFSAQYRLGVEHAWVLQLTDLELLLVGWILVWPIFGVDPKPRRLPVGWRVVDVMFGTIYYSVLGMAMQSQQTRIAPGLTISDLHTGGGNLWSTAELFSILATIGILYQWLFVDLGRARRADRFNAEEDAAQLAAWRAARREAALADVRARESLLVRSRPAGTDRSERSFLSGRRAPRDASRE